MRSRSRGKLTSKPPVRIPPVFQGRLDLVICPDDVRGTAARGNRMLATKQFSVVDVAASTCSIHRRRDSRLIIDFERNLVIIEPGLDTPQAPIPSLDVSGFERRIAARDRLGYLADYSADSPWRYLALGNW